MCEGVPEGEPHRRTDTAGPGADREVGTAITLVLSTGNPHVAVPDGVNQTQAATTTAITDAGLVLGAITTATSMTVPAGSVISQNPAAGADVEVGTAVALVISTGKPHVAVAVAECRHQEWHRIGPQLANRFPFRRQKGIEQGAARPFGQNLRQSHKRQHLPLGVAFADRLQGFHLDVLAGRLIDQRHELRIQFAVPAG